jgi:hypothetical protein
METDHLRKLQDAPKKQNVLFDEFRDNVANDDEIKKLIEELVPMADKWLAKHP